MIYSIKRFSKDSDNTKKAIGAAAVGVGLKVGGDKISNKIRKRLTELQAQSYEKGMEIKDNPEMVEKLRRLGKKRGVDFVERGHKDLESSHLGAGGPIKAARNLIDKGEKSKHPKLREAFKKANEEFSSAIGSKNWGKKPIITTAEGFKTRAGTLAHELGHNYYEHGKNVGVIGKVAHKLYAPSAMITDSKVGNGLLMADGFRRGKNSVKTDEEGNIKTNRKKMLKSAGLGLAVAAPRLVSEGAASLAGYNTLKKAGASKELLKYTRKDLGNAFGTYAAASLKPILSETSGHLAGEAYGRIREKNKKRKRS